MKSKIQDAKADHAVERQKLIHSGKVLKDTQTIAELGISESDFLVCMVSKEVAKVQIIALITVHIFDLQLILHIMP